MIPTPAGATKSARVKHIIALAGRTKLGNQTPLLLEPRFQKCILAVRVVDVLGHVILGPLASLGSGPVDILCRGFDVAGFAVDATVTSK